MSKGEIAFAPALKHLPMVRRDKHRHSGTVEGTCRQALHVACMSLLFEDRLIVGRDADTNRQGRASRCMCWITLARHIHGRMHKTSPWPTYTGR